MFSFSSHPNWSYDWSTYANSAPTDLNSTLPLNFAENIPIGSVIGEFNATDPDTNSTLTYHFVSGDNNNTFFTLEQNGTLKTATVFDFESNASSYLIQISVKDEYNATHEGNFTVNLTNVLENSAPKFTFSGNTIINSNFGVEFFSNQNSYVEILNESGSVVKVYVEDFDTKNFSGRLTLDVNPGFAGDGDIFKIYQGNNLIFNSGHWRTEGPFYSYDYDRFIIGFSQGIQTNFEFVPLDTNDGTNISSGQPTPNGNYDNKIHYLSALGLTDDGSPTGMSDLLGKKFSNLGQVTTGAADNNSTVFTIVVESPDVFTYKAFYQPIAHLHFSS